MIFCGNGKLIVRSVELSDKKLLVKWLSDNEVLQYYEGRDKPFNEKLVEEKFYKNNINVTKCIIEYYGKPIGYIQYYIVDEKECEEYGYLDFKGTIFGTDQFIGESNHWNQGIGKELMKLIVMFLSTDKGAEKIVLDPQTWNERAINCYEKSGYRKVKLLPKHELHEGELKDCWLMEYNVKNTEMKNNIL